MSVVVLPVDSLEKFSYWLFVIHFNQSVLLVSSQSVLDAKSRWLFIGSASRR